MKLQMTASLLAAGMLMTGTVLFGQAANEKASKPFKYIDPSNMDLSVKPGENFYLYANGSWIKTIRFRDLKPVGEV